MPDNLQIAAEAIRQRQDELGELINTYQYDRQPELWKPFGDTGRAKSLRDIGYHLTYLIEALKAGDPVIFIDYLVWVKVLFSGLKFREDVLPVTLDCTRQAINEKLPAEISREVIEFLDFCYQSYLAAPASESYLQADMPLVDLTRQYIAALLNGNRHAANDLILESARQGTSIQDLYLYVFQCSQREIGRLWQTNQISVAQEHYCTAATQMIMSQLYPYIFTGTKNGLHMVTTCVGGELHEIGARMVADFFEMGGWDTYFLGANTPMESILKTIAEHKSDLLAISATMTFHIGKVSDLISQLHKAGLDQRTKIMVGGYPFNISTHLWKSVGADGYAPDAKQALIVAERLVG